MKEKAKACIMKTGENNEKQSRHRWIEVYRLWKLHKGLYEFSLAADQWEGTCRK